MHDRLIIFRSVAKRRGIVFAVAMAIAAAPFIAFKAIVDKALK